MMGCQYTALRIFVPVLIMLLSLELSGQVDYVIIDSVIVTGIKKTKREVIMREIDLQPGDTIGLGQMAQKITANEKRILSTGLFTLVSINIKNWNTDNSTCNLAVEVRENWYIYPYPIFELADRNFNVWSREQNYSLKRVNYGVAFNHINFTGLKDKLKLKFQQGFTHKYEITYEYPYLLRGWGLSANYLYSQNRETAYIARDNKPVFLRLNDERTLLRSHRAGISLLHRSNVWLYHKFSAEYNNVSVDSVLVNEYNDRFLGEGRTSLRFLALDYLLRYDRTLYPLYPMGGYRMEANARKEGLGWLSNTDNAWIALAGEYHIPFLSRFIFSTRLKAKKNLLNNPLPYYLNGGIGYRDDNMMGYQLYVLDGRDFILSNNSIKLRILDRNFRMAEWFPQAYKLMNARLFLRFSFDYGYANDPVFGSINQYSNTHQYGFGPAFDAILFNTMTFSCEYGVTRFGEKGFFLRSDVNF